MLLNKTILVVVPARGGSKGVKLKNIRPLNGVPLVAITGRLVSKLPYVDRAIVSTDHPEIAEIAEKAGLAAPFYRSQELSGDMIGDWEVLNEALQKIEEIDRKNYDVIVMLQPTSPCRTQEHVTKTIRKLVEGSFDAVWTVSMTDAKSHPLKQYVVEGDRLDNYDPEGAKIIARQQLKPVYHRNGVAYAMTRECILAQKTIKGKNTAALVIDEQMANIDTEFDFKLAEFLISQGVVNVPC